MLIDEKIKAENVMLINSDGEKKGMMPLTKALEYAESSSLDLVQVSPKNSEPTVCKLLDYGKHLFEKKKSISSQRESTSA